MKFIPLLGAIAVLGVAVVLVSCGRSEPSATQKKDVTVEDKTARGKSIAAKVVSQEGCANTPPTIKRLEKIAEELNVVLTLEKVVVKTQEEADLHHFKGSPTVLINGLDLDPSMRTQGKYGFT